MAIKSISVRLDEELLYGIRKVAAFENRSVNKQIMVLIRDCIERYETEKRIGMEKPPHGLP